MWKMVKLGEVLKTAAGGTPLKSKKEFYDGGDVKWLLSGAVCEKDIVSSKTYITEKGLKNSSAKIFPVNTVLVAMYGATAGQTGILRIEAATNQAVCGILPDANYIPEFIYYYLSNYKEKLLEQVSGVAQPNLSQAKIKDVLIPQIDFLEQQQIVAKLDAAFAQIDRAIELAETKEADIEKLKASMLSAMLNNADWEAVKLGEVCDFVRGPFGGSLKKSVFVEDGFAVYEQQHAIRGQCESFRYFITPEKFETMRRFEVRAGDILMSCSGTIGKTTIVPELHRQGIINQALLKITPSQRVLANYLDYYMKSSLFTEQLMEGVDGAAIQNVASVKLLKQISIMLPSAEVQAFIIAKLDAAFAELDKAKASVAQIKANYTALKSAILASELQPEKSEAV